MACRFILPNGRVLDGVVSSSGSDFVDCLPPSSIPLGYYGAEPDVNAGLNSFKHYPDVLPNSIPVRVEVMHRISGRSSFMSSAKPVAENVTDTTGKEKSSRTYWHIAKSNLQVFRRYIKWSPTSESL